MKEKIDPKILEKFKIMSVADSDKKHTPKVSAEEAKIRREVREIFNADKYTKEAEALVQKDEIKSKKTKVDTTIH